MDIGITTCVWGTYHKYLPQWAASIKAQTLPPKQVRVVISGQTPEAQKNIEQVRKILPDVDIEWREYDSPAGMRNSAVEGLNTEWVMFMDADDTLLLHCIEMCSKVKGADVIALGYKRKINGKIENKDRLYKRISGIEALKAPVICPSLSPYKKSLWDQAKYEDFADATGGWDYALWIRFIHLGARFVPTPSAGFIYNIHNDSVFQKRVKNTGKGERNDVGRYLTHLRWGIEWPTSFLIPYQYVDEHREKALAYVTKRIKKDFPNAEILVGGLEGSDDKNFRKGVAVNNLFKKAKGNIIVMLDGDCLIDSDIIKRGIEIAKKGSWVVPHGKVFRLNERPTENLYKTGKVDKTDLYKTAYEGIAGGGCFIMNRWNYLRSGGMDERFLGWGGEDIAFGILCDAVLGKHTRLNADLIHLYHPFQPSRDGGYGKNNRAIGRGYVHIKNNSVHLHWIAEANRYNLTGKKGKPVYLLCKNLREFERKMGDMTEYLPRFIEIGRWGPTPMMFGVAKYLGAVGAKRLPYTEVISEKDFDLYMSRESQRLKPWELSNEQN